MSMSVRIKGIRLTRLEHGPDEICLSLCDAPPNFAVCPQDGAYAVVRVQRGTAEEWISRVFPGHTYSIFDATDPDRGMSSTLHAAEQHERDAALSEALLHVGKISPHPGVFVEQLPSVPGTMLPLVKQRDEP